MMSFICGIFFKKLVQMNLFYKTEIESQPERTNLWLPGAKREGINWEIGLDTHILPYMKQITSTNVPGSTGDSPQYSAATYVGEAF